MGNKQPQEPPKVVTANELSTYVMIIRAKLTQQRNKKVGEITKKRKELINYLKNNNPEMAKLKMDGIIQEENYITAFDILGTIMEIIKEKCTYLINSSQCPNDMRASLDTVLFASTRIEITEFKEFRDFMTIKFGGIYVSNATQNIDKLVNRQIVDKLTFTPNPEPFLISRVKQICKEEEIDYTFPEEVIPVDFNQINSEGLGQIQPMTFGTDSLQINNENNSNNQGNFQVLPTKSFIEFEGKSNPNQGTGMTTGSQPFNYDPNFGDSQYFNQGNPNNQNMQSQNFNNLNNPSYYNNSNNSNNQSNNVSQVSGNFNQPNNYQPNYQQDYQPNFQNVNSDFQGGPRYNVNMNPSQNQNDIDYSQPNSISNSNNVNNNYQLPNNQGSFNPINQNQINENISHSQNVNNNSVIKPNSQSQFNPNQGSNIQNDLNQGQNPTTQSFGTFQSQHQENNQDLQHKSINDYSIFTPNSNQSGNVNVNINNNQGGDVHENMFPSSNQSNNAGNNNGFDEFGFPEARK